MTVVIKNAIILQNAQEVLSDIEINDGKIVRIAKNIEAKECFDANNAYLLPGLIDLNVSLKDNSLNQKNIKKAASDALKGGVTTAVVDSNTDPRLDNEVSLEYFKSIAKLAGCENLKCSVVANKTDKELSNIAILYKQGASAVYINSSTDNNIIRRTLQYNKMYNKTLFCGVRDKALTSTGVMHDGALANELGLEGLTPLAEIIHVAKMIEMSKFLDVAILFKSISTARGLELINSAKKEGIKVSAEVSLHHLCKSDEECRNFNTYAKISPPLRDEKTVQAFVKSLKEGGIDILTSLHSPQSNINKEIAFGDAKYGTECIADVLPLYYTKLVKSNLISLSELITLTSTNPANILGENKGKIEVGYDAEFVLFNPNETYVIENKKSLYNNEKVQGRVKAVVIEGILNKTN